MLPPYCFVVVSCCYCSLLFTFCNQIVTHFRINCKPNFFFYFVKCHVSIAAQCVHPSSFLALACKFRNNLWRFCKNPTHLRGPDSRPESVFPAGPNRLSAPRMIRSSPWVCRESITRVSTAAIPPASAPRKEPANSKNVPGITTAPKGRYPVIHTTASPAKQLTAPHMGAPKIKHVQVTATPFPPRNRFQNGKLCPSTAPNPAQNTPNCPSSRHRSARHSRHANAVLPTSPANTAAPHRRPRCSVMLAMPGFPEPTSCARFPFPSWLPALQSGNSRRNTLPISRTLVPLASSSRQKMVFSPLAYSFSALLYGDCPDTFPRGAGLHSWTALPALMPCPCYFPQKSRSKRYDACFDLS